MSEKGKNEVLQEIKAALQDLTSLEVATLTSEKNNTLSLSLNESGKTTSKTNNDLFKEIRKTLDGSKLVAYTKYSLDGDSINFIENDDTYQKLVAGHSELVKSSLLARQNFFNTAFNIIGGVFNVETKTPETASS